MSTLKSSDDHLTLNADGSSKNILFQADGVQKASISSAGLLTSTTIDATALTGNLPAIDGSSLTGVGVASITDNGNANAITIDSSENVQIDSGNLVIGTAGKGIDFSATADASAMDNELLDDYEEGTWTPVIAGTSSAGTYTYGSASNAGRYTKVGNLVTVWGNLANIVAVSAGSGNLKVTGLPFSSASGVAYYQSCIVNNWSSAETPKTYMGASESVIYFTTYGDMSGASSNIAITDITSSSSDIRFMINYRA